ncbi:sugar ABC transporter permease [Alkalihalobacillus sp. LMS39]|uniref:sugar ABC transporter permease n=1 Tax=Alkalihalobacillus sp. LMS39 TaxID=2924032 RepID=UPI001FB44F86|nr:sugar ABC transporter permease [Alkalihalobacillus sp. LMS39]UOE95378.1 sugar ABC transporter permease [Alkalihalobacillus sp. LMS39]
MSRKTKSIMQLTGIYIIIAIMFVVILYPIAWTLGASFNPSPSLVTASLIPNNASLIHYEWLFGENSRYLTWYWNTVKVATANSIIATFLIALVAYAFSRYRFVGRKNGMYMFLLLQMFPAIMGMVALYIMLSVFGLLNSLLGLTLIYIGTAIPLNAFLVKGYFDTIPRELDESAKLDGAGHFRIFFTIMLPLAKPIIAVVALFNFMGPFMDFILPRILLRTPENFTLALGLYNLVNDSYASDFSRFAAGSILVAIPIAAVFLFLQRYLITGLSSGATKG